jgi:hypothetical protein
MTQKMRPVYLFIVVAVMASLYTLWWFKTLGAFKQEVAQWAHPSADIQIKGDAVSFGGFPYRHEVEFTKASLSRTRGDYRLFIKAEKVRITHTAWSKDFFVGEMAQPVISLLAPSLKDSLQETQATATAAQFSLRLFSTHVERVSLAFENFQSFLPGKSAPFSAQRFEIHGREHGASADKKPATSLPILFDFYVSALKLKLEGQEFTLASMWEINGSAPANTLEDWRASGGTVELKSVALKRGTTLDTTGNATISLDKRGHIIAAGALKTGCAKRLYDLFDVTPRQDVPSCGSVLRDVSFQRIDGRNSLNTQ